jgi:peptide/nickel transport system permease protein
VFLYHGDRWRASKTWELAVLNYIVRRLLYSVIVLLGVVTVVFITLRLTGDPVQMLLAEGNPSQEDIEELRRVLALDKPLPLQYVDTISKMARGDFGRSFRYGTPALNEVIRRMPATLELAGGAYVVALLIAIPTGILSAIRRGGAVDFFSRLVSLVGVSFPNFWLGLMLILLFAVQLQWLPASGRAPDGGFVNKLESLILPSLTLGAGLAAVLTRLLRSSMLDVMGSEYIKVARAKGLRDSHVIWRHALKNAMIPVVTIMGLQVGFLLGGSVIVEVVFSWPGVGRLAVDAIGNRDYPVVQAAVVFLASFLILANLIVDLLYSWLDPRITYS